MNLGLHTNARYHDSPDWHEPGTTQGFGFDEKAYEALPVDLRRIAAEVIRTESEKSPMARKVHASFTKFQALVGAWDHVADSAYHQLVAS